MPTLLPEPGSHLAHLQESPRLRYEAGRARRADVPLDAHGEIVARPQRDPVWILGQQDRSRVPELIPLRYGRMSRTPFTFLRGAAAVMAYDLSAAPRTDLRVELCGDAHLGNFRWYRAPNRSLVFDVNDFDETLGGPFEWDVKRLAASVMIAGRNNGFSGKQCRAAVRSAMANYRKYIAVSAGLNPLELYYYRFESDTALELVRRHGKRHRKHMKKVLGKAAKKNSLRAFRKLTREVDGHPMIVPDPPLIVRVDETLASTERDEVAACFSQYRQTLSLERRLLLDRFSLVDVARKVVGVGSVGTRCLILLLVAGDGTPLFLQFKQAVASVLEPYLEPSLFDQAGQRVVEGQRLIQATSDIFLGWSRIQIADQSVDFYFRQLWDGKGKIDVEDMEADDLAVYAGICGKTLAFAHARSGDAMMIHGYIDDGKAFENALLRFSRRYADQTEADHDQLNRMIDDEALEVMRDI